MFSTPGSDIWPSPLRPIAALGRLSVEMVLGLGQFGRFCIQGAGYTVIPPFKFGRLVDRSHFIGLVLGLPIFLTLSRFGSEAYLGPAVALSLIRELGPVLCAVFVPGIPGSVLTAEIGIMKITEQIDALHVMALNPMRYLVSPALVAGVITFPLLTAIFDVVGILGGYLVGVELLGLSPGTYFGEMKTFVTMSDLMTGYWKAISFGIIVPWVCTYKGFNCGHGAEGVARATTQAVVLTSILILVWDYFLGSVLS